MGIEKFSATTVVVVGDLMLDEFVRGDVTRISPEAPVPILDMRDRSSTPGGAANAANNVRSLGARASLVGVVGDDASAAALSSLLRLAGIDTTGIVTDRDRPTTQKTRVVARGQQVVRIDSESRAPLGPTITEALMRATRDALATAEACIVSDYGKGVITPELVAAIVEIAQARKIPVVVDPKRKDFAAYRGATVVTPNLGELEMASGRHAESTDEVVAAGSALLPALGGGALLITRGAAGMTLLEPGQAPVHTHARARAVFDVTGAGDTVVSTLALSLAAGITLAESIELASVAAGLVVSKAGTATVTSDELRAASALLRPHDPLGNDELVAVPRPKPDA
jgi:D-beta-D-heptose 7-phosphate kinase/D-beta-D-heptose 1-phosphate adenosyltransferase